MKEVLKNYETARKCMFRALNKEELGDLSAEDLFCRARDQFSRFLSFSALTHGAYGELVGVANHRFSN